MNLRQSISAGLLVIPALLVVGTAQATPVTGQANIAGNVTVSQTAINFQPSFTNTSGAMETGDFAGLTGGTIGSLTGGPATGATNIPKFATFSTGVASPVFFDLTFISPGVGTAGACSSTTPGAQCTPPGSPFTLLQLTSNTVAVTLQLNGVSYTGTSASGSSQTTSIFSTQVVFDGSIPAIISTLQSGGTLTGITYSASFIATSPVPEPASMLLIGVGLMGAGLVARRRFVK